MTTAKAKLMEAQRRSVLQLIQTLCLGDYAVEQTMTDFLDAMIQVGLEPMTAWLVMTRMAELYDYRQRRQDHERSRLSE